MISNIGAGKLSYSIKTSYGRESCSFKRFGIDSIDLEIDTEDTKEIINTTKHIAKSFASKP